MRPADGIRWERRIDWGLRPRGLGLEFASDAAEPPESEKVFRHHGGQTQHPDHRVGTPGQEEVLRVWCGNDNDDPCQCLPIHPHPHPAASSEGEEPLPWDLRCLHQDPASRWYHWPLPRVPGQYLHPHLWPVLCHHL
ncbi:hypothetical protein H8959_018092 [Pygathrix nigripes]